METKIQQLGKRNTYTPTNTSQVCSSVSLSLNKEETLSEQTSKTFSNNLEENQQSSKTERNMSVFVINLRKEPLMPCSSTKARHLLRDKKAKVVSRKPFTIQLIIATGETKQKITLGIDAGSKIIGYSATTNMKELICGELELRQDVSKKLTERRMYRRLKRNKLWYRQPRFLNRTRSKKKGWLAPSIQHKIDTHIQLVEKIKLLIPITKTIIEIAKFDTQKLQNIDIKGVEYQEGEMKDYDNLRAFILYRDNYTCQICNKKEGILNIHHIIQRKDGGSNRPDNLVTLHKKCHDNFHDGKNKHVFKKPESFKDTVVMNNIRKYVVDKIDCEYTFGYITKRNRINNKLEKTHYNDAFIISDGSNQERIIAKETKQVRRNNRQLQQNRKGCKLSIRKQRYKIQSGDKLKYNNKNFICNGVFNKGLYCSFVKNDFGIKYGKYKLCQVINHGKGISI